MEVNCSLSAGICIQKMNVLQPLSGCATAELICRYSAHLILHSLPHHWHPAW